MQWCHHPFNPHSCKRSLSSSCSFSTFSCTTSLRGVGSSSSPQPRWYPTQAPLLPKGPTLSLNTAWSQLRGTKLAAPPDYMCVNLHIHISVPQHAHQPPAFSFFASRHPILSSPYCLVTISAPTKASINHDRMHKAAAGMAVAVTQPLIRSKQPQPPSLCCGFSLIPTTSPSTFSLPHNPPT